MFYAQVIYVDQKGAGCMRAFGDAAKLSTFLSKLRRDADIKNATGETVGNVWKDEHDGNKGKWRWVYDSDALQTST